MASHKLSRRYIAALALAAGAILWLGWMLRPAPRALESQGIETPSDLVRLQQRTQRRSLEDLAGYFAETAHQAQRFVLRLESLRQSAVIWDNRAVLTANTGKVFPDWDSLAIAEVNLGAAETALTGPHLPISLLVPIDRTELAPPVRRSAGALAAGQWLVAVWRRENRSHTFLPGHFAEARPTTCREQPLVELFTDIALHSGMAGGGVFDLDGNLVALVARCGGRVTLLGAASVAELVDSADPFESIVMARYGMRLDSLTPADHKYSKAEYGMIVREVWRGYTASEAGLLPGDILIAIDGQPVTSVNDIQPFALPVAREIFELQIVRRGQERRVELRARGGPTPGSRHDNAPAGLIWRKLSEEGFAIEDVLPQTSATQAGIQPGDRVLAVNHRRPRNLAELQTLLAAAGQRPTHLVLERQGRLWGVLL